MTTGTINLETLSKCEVQIVSLRGRTPGIEGGKKYKIQDLRFQVSLDGKCITLISLVGLPGITFTWDQLKLILHGNN